MNNMTNESFSPEKNHCPFCESELVKQQDRCIQCGAERVKGHVSASERRKIRYLRIVLVAIWAVIFSAFYPASSNFELKGLLFIVAIAASLIIPALYFKIKNKDNVIWKKKAIPW
jgi:hypothetical protein